MASVAIDTSFDFRTDAAGKDPDSFSPALRRYHRLLWSKPLPCGRPFQLADDVPGAYLHHRSALNGARGFDRRIADRFDLTLECIRRHYVGARSPLGETLARYGEFFALFGGFSGYVDFFLLQDLVTKDQSAVAFFLNFDDFASAGTPQDGDRYREYRRRSTAFVQARNRRIAAAAQ